MQTFEPKQKSGHQTNSASSRAQVASLAATDTASSTVFHLQRTIGNQAAQRMLQGNSEIPEVDAASATARFAHDFSQIPINARGTDVPPDHRNWPFYRALRVSNRNIRRNQPKRITAI